MNYGIETNRGQPHPGCGKTYRTASGNLSRVRKVLRYAADGEHDRSRTVDVLQRRLRKGRTGYWDLGDSYYIHFIAVYPEKRNHKIGQHILDWVGEHLHRPVFLEAEIPYDAITARRLCFYKRNGFLELAENPGTLADHRRGGHPLWFMGTRAVENLENHLTQVRERVYYATGE